MTMLSCVLNDEMAIHINIQIIRIYTRVREMLIANKDVFIRVEQVEKQVVNQDQKIEQLFNHLWQFIEKENVPREEIGYKRKGK